MSTDSNAEADRGRQVTVDIEVRYAETDQMGIVHHAVYPVWFELARTRLCTETGYHYAQIEELGYFLMVSGVEVRYLKGAHYGDTVAITCWLHEIRSRTLRFGYEVQRADGTDVARGFTDHVWVERESGKACRIPAELKEPFYRVAGREPGSRKNRS